MCPSKPSLALLLPVVLSMLQSVACSEQGWRLKNLEDYIRLYTGEFSNQRQNSEDIANNITGPELHFLLRQTHVPVLVKALQVVGKESRQVYLEQRANNATNPTRQRIYNVKLQDDGSLEVELYQYQNATALLEFSNWRTDRSIFHDLQANLLFHDPLCNVVWTRGGPAFFSSSKDDMACRFTFIGSLVYIFSKVNLTRDAIIQDEKFIRVSDGSRAGGATLPYVFDRVGDVPQLPDCPPGSGPCLAVANVACNLPTNNWFRSKLMTVFPECFPVMCPQDDD